MYKWFIMLKSVLIIKILVTNMYTSNNSAMTHKNKPGHTGKTDKIMSIAFFHHRY